MARGTAGGSGVSDAPLRVFLRVRGHCVLPNRCLSMLIVCNFCKDQPPAPIPNPSPIKGKGTGSKGGGEFRRGSGGEFRKPLSLMPVLSRVEGGEGARGRGLPAARDSCIETASEAEFAGEA